MNVLFARLGRCFAGMGLCIVAAHLAFPRVRRIFRHHFAAALSAVVPSSVCMRGASAEGEARQDGYEESERGCLNRFHGRQSRNTRHDVHTMDCQKLIQPSHRRS